MPRSSLTTTGTRGCGPAARAARRSRDCPFDALGWRPGVAARVRWAGALITDTRLPSVSTDSAAADWSSRNPFSVRASRASRARPASACSSRSASTPSTRAASARVSRGAPSARACESMRSSMASCGRVAYRTPPAVGRRCARRRAASCAAPAPPRVLPGTGSNSDRKARSARSSSSAAAAAGSRPDLGSTRPRYLIRSARVQVLFSCCASATAFCAPRLRSSWLSAGRVRPRRAGPRPHDRTRHARPTARPTPAGRRGCARAYPPIRCAAARSPARRPSPCA